MVESVRSRFERKALGVFGGAIALTLLSCATAIGLEPVTYGDVSKPEGGTDVKDVVTADVAPSEGGSSFCAGLEPFLLCTSFDDRKTLEAGGWTVRRAASSSVDVEIAKQTKSSPGALHIVHQTTEGTLNGILHDLDAVLTTRVELRASVLMHPPPSKLEFMTLYLRGSSSDAELKVYDDGLNLSGPDVQVAKTFPSKIPVDSWSEVRVVVEKGSPMRMTVTLGSTELVTAEASFALEKVFQLQLGLLANGDILYDDVVLRLVP